MKKTHRVIDLHYTEEEGNVDLIGTYQECLEYASQQTPHFMYRVEPLTMEEYLYANRDILTPTTNQ